MPESNNGPANNVSTSAVFAWSAAVLFNAAFAALVFWGTLRNWIIGFVISLVYTLLIFFVTFRLKRRNQNEAGGDGHTVLTSVLFLLAVAAIGVTGNFLPLNLIKCPCISNAGTTAPSGTGTWVTNTTGFSEEVATWAHKKYTSTPATTFMYFPETQTIVFAGTGGPSLFKHEHETTLWKSSQGDAPELMDSTLLYPSNFVQAPNGALGCLVAQTMAGYASAIIACTDGHGVNTTRGVQGLPWDLLYADNVVWFKVTGLRQNQVYYDGTFIYSVDPSDLSYFTLHSYFRSGSDGDYDACGGGASCDVSFVRRYISLGSLCLSILPVFAVSVLLLVKHDVPSMPVAGYTALTGVLVALAFIVNPDFTGVGNLLRWWLPFSSLFWILSDTIAHLTNRIRPSTLTWSMNFSAVVFFVGMLILFKIPFGGSEYDVWWRWILITLTVFFPLIVLSVIVGKLLLVALGAMGILVDIWRLVTFLTIHLDAQIRTPVQFVVLALAGLGVALFGVFLNRRQGKFRESVESWSARNLSRWRIPQCFDNSHMLTHSMKEDCIDAGDSRVIETAVVVR